MDRLIGVDSEHLYDMDRRHRQHSSDFSKKGDDSLLDERIDSGFASGDLPSLSSVDSVEEQPDKNSSDLSSSSSYDLSNHISKLNIDSSSRLDSGISESEDIQTSSDLSSSEWVSSAYASKLFSAQQIAEIFRADEDGDSHLHLSIIHGSEHITNQIISLAPDWEWVNHENNLLQTPLHLAVITRQASVVRRLMCAGASVDVRDENGNTPLHNACRLGFEDVVRTLLSPVRFEETYQNRYDIPFQRIPQDLDSRNYEGLSCLHLAAIGGHLHVMRLLLAAGASVNAPEGKNGRTVLHMAADWGHIEMLKFLLQRRDTDIDADTYAGLTPVILAFGRNHFDAVEVLRMNGASYDIGLLNEESEMDSSDDEPSESASSSRLHRAAVPNSNQVFMQTCR